MQEQAKYNDELRIKMKEKDQSESGLGQRAQEQGWNHCAVQEQTCGKVSGNTTQTRNLGVRTWMAVIVAMLIAGITIAAFANGDIVGSSTRIRPDRMWITHNLVDGLKNLLGSQELEPRRTNNMAWTFELDAAKSSRTTQELEFSGATSNQIARKLEFSGAESREIARELEFGGAKSD